MNDPSHLRHLACIGLVSLVGAGACISESDQEPSEDLVEAGQEISSQSNNNTGKKLFERETFDGNGRACATCHSSETGTLDPETIVELSEEDPENPLFHPLDSDDGSGASYERLKSNATIRMRIPLPPNIRLYDDPEATHVELNRGIPTMVNAALQTHLLADGRQTSLEAQALGAIQDHAQPGTEPTEDQLQKIADYERTLFSSKALRRYAAGGAPPVLPPGETESEQRGREFFEPDGRCGKCHGGPMLNRTTEFEDIIFTGPDAAFSTVFAGFPLALGFDQPEDAPNPIRLWEMDCQYDLNGNGTIENNENGGFACEVAPFFGGWVEDGKAIMPMPDLGRPLADGDIDNFMFVKIPTLWGVAETAPFFHDNSARDLEAVMDQYDKLFQVFTGQGLTDQEKADVIAYVNLL